MTCSVFLLFVILVLSIAVQQLIALNERLSKQNEINRTRLQGISDWFVKTVDDERKGRVLLEERVIDSEQERGELIREVGRIVDFLKGE